MLSKIIYSKLRRSSVKCSPALRMMCSTKSDADLQREYLGIFPRLISILNVFTDEENKIALNKLQSDNIIAKGCPFFYPDLFSLLLHLRYDLSYS
jgi:hypothetical protein